MERTAENLIKIALAQLGYHEKASNAALDDKTANSGSGNWTMYARDLANAGYYNGNKNGYAWCDVFVDWCFWTLCGHNKAEAEAMQCQTGPLGAGCQFSRQYYANQHRLSTTPQLGDQVFFRNGSEVYHTGIVVAISGNTFTTVEGNAGDCVSRRVYTLNPSKYDFGHPKFAAVSGETSDEPQEEPKAEEKRTPVYEYSVKLPLLKLGSTGYAVKSMQQLLIAKGYTCGGYGADGEFGTGTLISLKNFQDMNGLDVDGECGGDTWKKLITG